MIQRAHLILSLLDGMLISTLQELRETRLPHSTGSVALDIEEIQ